MFEYGLAQKSFKKAFLERNMKGGFGSTAQRSSFPHNKESIMVPSPGQYKVGRAINIVINICSFLSIEILICIRLICKARI